MGARFTYTGHRLDQIVLRDLARGAGDLEARAARVLAAAQTLVGVDTGRLLASIHRERGRNSVGPYVDIVSGIPGITNYLGYHHFGAGPHIIRARRRKALRFIWRGEVVFFKWVRHPGNRGTYFLTRALDAAR